MALSCRSLVVVICAILYDVQCAYSKDGFLATLPKVLRHRTPAEFCLTVYNDDTGAQQTSFSFKDQDSGDIALKVDTLYEPGVQKCINFEVPDAGNYDLVISNDRGVLQNTSVKVNEDRPLTLVQTDKPIYKPGQTVKFRILTLLHDMKPRIGKIDSVYVLDPNSIRVKQYLNVDNQGLTSLEFQLVDRAKLGEWTIEVDLDGVSRTPMTTFQVDEYVLPRFEIHINPPSYILATDEIFKGEVCAVYTYGKPVSGFLDLSIYWSYTRGTVYKEAVEMSGCHNFTVRRTDLVEPAPPSRWTRRYFGNLQIEASVTEAGTGFVVNKTLAGPQDSFEPLEISMDDYTNGFFKPGLPYFGKVTMKKPDGTPAAGEIVRIRATTRPVKAHYSQNFTTDENGVVIYALCDSFTENSTSIAIDVKAIEYDTPDQQSPPTDKVRLYTPTSYTSITQWFSPSLSYVQIPKIDTVEECSNQLTLSIPFTTVAKKDITFNYQIMSRGQIVQSGQVEYNHTQGYPGTDYANIPEVYCLKAEVIPTVPPTPDSNGGEDDDIEVSNGEDEEDEEEDYEEDPSSDDVPRPPIDETSVVNDPVYPPLGRGDDDGEISEPIVRSAVVANANANFILNFVVTTEMSPSFTLLVYHVLEDGEVVADSTEFQVKPCFANKVSFEFNKTESLPGEDVDLTLKASPGSICGLGVVDKSVNILGGNHQITPDVVFKRIQEESKVDMVPFQMPFGNDADYCEEKMKKLEDSSNPDEFWYYVSNYVDASEAFKTSGFQVFTNLNLETRPCQRTYPIYYDLPLSLVYEEEDPDMKLVPGNVALETTVPNIKTKPKARVRSRFPESWLWSLEMVGTDGESVINEKAPDTVTTWVGNAMCMDQEAGFGVSEMTSLTTFQPLFVSLQLPYAAVRGERLPVILTIYNYLDKCLHIQMSLNADENFEVHNAMWNAKPICLCDGKSHSARYYVTPLNIGSLEIMAKATVIPGSCSSSSIETDLDYVGYSDAVKRKMLVKAEGVMQEYSTAMYICTKEGETNTEDVILPLPEKMVKDSARGELKVIGDIMGPVMSSMSDLVRIPTGCGEQNMVGFVPNICVVKYLTNTGRLSEAIKAEATKNMEIGYQRELTYRHEDGSYSAFGENDPEGSVWLSAFVLKSYAQAKPYIYIDQKEIESIIHFLSTSQLETGCFRETGKVLSSHMMGGLGKKKKNTYTALTAYVLGALLKAGVNTSEHGIKEGMKCMQREFKSERNKVDPYTLALVAYVSTLYDPFSHTTTQVLKTLDAMAKKDGSLRYWGRDTHKPPPVNTWYYYAAPSAEVEMTSYALLALLNFYGETAVSQTHDIAMWLSQQRNANGGFSSTQDTIMGLQALSEFAELAYTQEGSDLTITVTGNSLVKEFRVSEELDNTLLLQSTPITKLPNRVQIETRGVGCALVQASVSYNKPANKMVTEGRPPFHLKVAPKLYQHDKNRCDRRTLAFHMRLKNKKFSSGMTLMTVRMVTSWRPMEDSLIRLKSQFPLLGIKQYEYKEDQGLLTFYFDEMSRKMKIFTLDIEQDRDLKISSPKPAEVKVYQYYETDVTVAKAYSVRTTCGTKEELPYGPPDPFADSGEFPSQVRLDRPRGIPPFLASRQDTTCPVCSSSRKAPENLKEVVCRSAAVYKTLAGRTGRKPLKIKVDMKLGPKSKPLNAFSKYTMPEGCECEQLLPPNKRVLIFVKEKMTKKTVRLNGSSMVLPMSKDINKAVKKLRRVCQRENPQS